MQYAGELGNEIQIASMCNDGNLLVAGGVLDQPSWLTKLTHRLNYESMRIARE
jgi:hypothetical protein